MEGLMCLAPVLIAGNGGTYCLVISLVQEKEITVGRLGRFHFPAGFYIYTGKAVRGLRTRVQRHLRRDKPLRWHIDYLTCLDQTQVEGVVFYFYANEMECQINQRIMGWKGAKIVVSGFGSSDCNQGCKSHLVYFADRPREQAFETIGYYQWNIFPGISNFIERGNYKRE